jgi:hypothetical protein
VQEDDKFAVFQAVTGMFEAHGKPRPSPAALKLYWDALDRTRREDFEAAMVRAASELKWPARPAELRELARETKNGGGVQGPVQQRCHWHGDGRHERGGVGRPDQPSPNPTMWWCDRCAFFVEKGLQVDEGGPTFPALSEVVRAIADEQERR